MYFRQTIPMLFLHQKSVTRPLKLQSLPDPHLSGSFFGPPTSPVFGFVSPWNSGGAGSGVANVASPRGIVVDAAGNLYLSDVSNHQVRRISSNGTETVVAGTGVIGGMLFATFFGVIPVFFFFGGA